ncbi:MAG: hypothetical protein RL077_1616 [Verrucomicrobiota bacterium]
MIKGRVAGVVGSGTVERVDGGVEDGSEGHPSDVRSPEPAGDAIDAPEANQDKDQQSPERGDIEKGEVGAAPSEEAERPKGVEAELGAINSPDGRSGRADLNSPDSPGGDGHRGVEAAPHGTEYPAGGIPRRLVE